MLHGHHLTHIDDPGPAKVPAGLPMAFLAFGVIGLIAFLLGAFGIVDSSRTAIQQAWMGFFVSYLFFWFLSLGAAAFLAINYIVSAKWFIVLKRPLESLASFSYMGGFLFPIFGLLATTEIYPWAQPDKYYPYAGTMKEIYLSVPVHWVKVILWTAVLTVMTYFLVKKSTHPTKKDAAFRDDMIKCSIVYMIVFSVAFSFFSLDVIKSLEPKWFSTMFGVYCFIGAFLSAMAATMLIAFWLKEKAPKVVKDHHMYDMGTYVMAFATFMVYIGFSQYMLIWYANIPDEIRYFMVREQGGWEVYTILLPVLKWVIPFFLLMPPPFRTNLYVQSFVCVSVLLGQFVDIFWMVAPAIPITAGGDFLAMDPINRMAYSPDIINIVTFFGVAGIFGFTTLKFLGNHSVLPTSDPDLLMSANGEYLHA